MFTCVDAALGDLITGCASPISDVDPFVSYIFGDMGVAVSEMLILCTLSTLLSF